MLVLTRRVGQRVLIGDKIQIELLGITEGRVRLGIVAPRDLEVDREEVREIKVTRLRDSSRLAR